MGPVSLSAIRHVSRARSVLPKPDDSRSLGGSKFPGWWASTTLMRWLGTPPRGHPAILSQIKLKAFWSPSSCGCRCRRPSCIAICHPLTPATLALRGPARCDCSARVCAAKSGRIAVTAQHCCWPLLVQLRYDTTERQQVFISADPQVSRLMGPDRHELRTKWHRPHRCPLARKNGPASCALWFLFALIGSRLYSFFSLFSFGHCCMGSKEKTKLPGGFLETANTTWTFT